MGIISDQDRMRSFVRIRIRSVDLERKKVSGSGCDPGKCLFL